MSKRSVVILITILFVIFTKNLSAATAELLNESFSSQDTLCDTNAVQNEQQSTTIPEETFRKKKLITSILAFPLPFGFIGLHRIYLGTDPWVPIVYLCTGGGGCGLLPLIDFIYLVTADEEEFKKYENNPRLFMFVD